MFHMDNTFWRLAQHCHPVLMLFFVGTRKKVGLPTFAIFKKWESVPRMRCGFVFRLWIFMEPERDLGARPLLKTQRDAASGHDANLSPVIAVMLSG